MEGVTLNLSGFEMPSWCTAPSRAVRLSDFGRTPLTPSSTPLPPPHPPPPGVRGFILLKTTVSTICDAGLHQN